MIPQVEYRYRVTKYNPINRAPGGSYIVDEWTSFEQVGSEVTMGEYREVENKYCDSALALLSSTSFPLVVRDLGGPWGTPETQLASGQAIDDVGLASALRELLRGRYWCRLESKEGYVHVGWDLYMYIGCSKAPEEAGSIVSAIGLFIERFDSPHAVRDHLLAD